MSTTLEELVVTLQAENSQFIAQMAASQKATEDATKAMAEAIQKMSEDSGKHSEGLGHAWETMLGVIGGELAVKAFEKAGEVAKELFNFLIVEGVKAASEEANAMQALSRALGNVGNNTEETRGHLIHLAEQYERTTTFTAKQILSSEALIESLGRLDKDGLERATNAAVRLSVGLGVDLETATRLVGKSAEGNVAGFKRYGIELEGGADKAIVFAKAMDVLESRFARVDDGVKTVGSAFVQMHNAVESIQKVFGNLIIDNQAILDAMKALNKELFNVADSAKESSESLRAMVADGLVTAIEWTGIFIGMTDTMNRAVTALWRATAGFVVGAALELAQALNFVGLTSDKTVNDLKKMAAGIGSVSAALTEETGLSKFQEKLANIGFAAEKGAEKVKAGHHVIDDAAKNTTSKFEFLTEVHKLQQQQVESLAKSYLNDSMSAEVNAKMKLEHAQVLRDGAVQDAKFQKDQITFNLFNQVDAYEKEKQANIKFFETKREILEEEQKKEKQQLAKARKDGVIDEQMYQVDLTQMKKKYTLEREKLDHEYSSFQKTMTNEELKSAKAKVADLSSLADSQNAYAKEVGKKFAIANAVISTEEGAIAAYKAMAGIPFIGPVLGIAAAAAVVADGASRISKIQGAKSGITEVPGMGTEDNFGPVALAPGERVVDANTNADLKAAIAKLLSQDNGGGSAHIEISIKPEAVPYIEAELIKRDRIGVSIGRLA